MNQIIITGRLTEDPKVTYKAGKEPTAHATFNFAVPDMTRQKDDKGNYPSDFFRCSCWNKRAETVERHCKKGMKLLISGRLKNNNYEKDGQKVYSHEIEIDYMEFLETKKSGANAGTPEPAEPDAGTEGQAARNMMRIQKVNKL